MDGETIFAVVVIGALGWAVPFVLMRFLPDSLRGLLVAVIASVALLALAGTGLFFWLYAGDVGIRAATTPQAALHFWSLGVRAALIWGPILALTAIAFGTGIERRRGERMAARDPD